MAQLEPVEEQLAEPVLVAGLIAELDPEPVML